MKNFPFSDKQALRAASLEARKRLENRATANQQILERVLTEIEKTRPRHVLIYTNVRTEVSTEVLQANAINQVGEVVVPYCLPDFQLGLFRLRNQAELSIGRYGIAEPALELRKDRHISPGEIDIAILPGVAFDLQGNRLGYGKGYFDRLLPQLPKHCVKVGLAFECQLVPQVLVETHDIPVDLVITETRTIVCS